jgi:hypothetical protein
LTQFDSGRHVVPSIKIFINSKFFLTDSLLVEVANVQVDTLKQKKCSILRTLQPADNSIGDWWKYVLIVALILGIGVLIYWFIKTSREKNYIKKFIKPNRKPPVY